MHTHARAALAALLLAASPALAQPIPPVPPVPPAPPSAPAPARPAVNPPEKPKPPPPRPALQQPAPPRPAPPRPPPVVNSKPGTPAKPPARPPVAAAVPATPPAPPPPEPEKPVEPSKGSNSGQPLPRFAALKSDEVNMRAGPGTRYPVEWLYRRRDLPVQVEREFDVWRLVRDPEGVKGWIHQAGLTTRRTAVVVGAEHPLRRDPRDDAATVARLKPGVILRVRSCELAADWCQGQVQDYRGWIRRTEIWGTLPGEAIQ